MDEDLVNEGDFQCIYHATCGRLFRTQSDVLRHLAAAHVPANERAGPGEFPKFGRPKWLG